MTVVRLVICAWLLLLLSPCAPAQQKIDCSKVFSLGCNSFNELIDAKDAEVLRSINTDGTAARVCFVEGQDNFFVMSFGLPPTEKFGWHKDKDGLAYSSNSKSAHFKRYKDGVIDDTIFFRITWHKFSEDDDPAADGKGALGRTAELYIDSDETTLTAKWLNKANNFTTFQLSIRLATGRFKESFTAKDEKGKLIDYSNTGHCFRYQDGLHD